MKQDRMARVNRLIQATLADLLPEAVKDPRVANQQLLTIVAVRTTRDLRYAKVYYTLLGTAQEQRWVQEGLERARGCLRGELAHRLRLRYTPELEFPPDSTQESAAHIEQVLREIAEEGDGGEG